MLTNRKIDEALFSYHCDNIMTVEICEGFSILYSTLRYIQFKSDLIKMILGASKVIYQLLSNRIYVAVIISQNWISESVLHYKFVHFY